jgi:predicted hotdog family 3-hydroxylacyl-ACP dehydratase
VRILPFGLAMLLLTGCHLIDQTDFAPKQAVKPRPPPIADPDTRPALVTIEYAKANPDYAAALDGAIKAAETRRPGLLYDVVAVVANAADAPTARTRAADVMTGIEAAGVIPARIRLGLRLDPGRKIPQVRVYLR